MLKIGLNAILALIFLNFARMSLIRVIPLVQVGWNAISVQVRKPDYRTDVDSRRKISEGSTLLIAGVIWGISSAVMLGLAVFFSVEMVRLYFELN